MYSMARLCQDVLSKQRAGVINSSGGDNPRRGVYSQNECRLMRPRAPGIPVSCVEGPFVSTRVVSACSRAIERTGSGRTRQCVAKTYKPTPTVTASTMEYGMCGVYPL
jgi:hypothetical protein